MLYAAIDVVGSLPSVGLWENYPLWSKGYEETANALYVKIDIGFVTTGYRSYVWD